MDVGDILKKVRDDLDMTQEEMADLLEISRSHYANIESGKNPSFELFVRMMDLLGKDIFLNTNVPEIDKTA